MKSTSISKKASIYHSSAWLLLFQVIHLLFNMNVWSLMASSIYWPPQRDTHLPHKYAGWRTKLSLWSRSRLSISKRLVTVGMKNGELQTLTMNFVTSTLTLITNVVTTPISVCQYNLKYHNIHFGSCYMVFWSCKHSCTIWNSAICLRWWPSLHSIPWTRGETYDHIFGQYSDKPSTIMSQIKIISSPWKALVCLYKGMSLHCFNVLRYDKLCVRAATNRPTAKTDDLSFTSAYIKYHSLRYNNC